MANKPSSHLILRVAGKGNNAALEPFLDVARDTLTILRELEENVTGHPKGTIQWEVVDASVKSPLTLELQPTTPSMFEDSGRLVVDEYLRGIKALNTGRGIPTSFRSSETILHAAKHMVQLSGDGAGRIEFASPGRAPVVPTAKLIAVVDSLEEKAAPEPTGPARQYSAIGSLEGVATSLKTANQDHFILRERLSGEDVKCTFAGEDLEDSARAAWKRRVLVFGLVAYSDGIPKSIQVEAIRLLRDSTKLPQFKDFGIDITGGVDSAVYVREMRDE